jgi:tetratricopeptide (TPR) repeat protein
MTYKYILRAFWASISVLTIWSCSRPARSTPSQTITFIAVTKISAQITLPVFAPKSTLAAPLTQTPLFTKTATVTPTPTPTITYQPTATPSATITPVPTILPTITPTFDAYRLTTATRSPAEVCPEVNSDVKPPDFEALSQPPPIIKHFQQDYLDYFNNGGIVGNLLTYWQPDYTIDLTNDGVPEYIIRRWDFFILGCHEGKYQLLLNEKKTDQGGGGYAYEIKDANKNGIPEVILGVNKTPESESFVVVEWDGTQFRSLLVPNDRNINMNGVYEDPSERADLKFEAMDLDPLLDLAVHLYPPYFDDSFDDGYPWRHEVDYYKWNGSAYVFAKQVYAPPLFRFQAVHDGDWAFLRGEYEQAINYYQQAIKDDNLYWYTESRRNFLLMNEPGWNSPKTIPARPVYDPDEYPNLAAYSYFRMMLAEIKKDRLARAETTYDWLQANFTTDMPGHIYSELATIFWTEFQKTQDFSMSCLLTYDFASSHPEEIFRYITTQIVINKKLITWPEPINFGYQSAELEYSPAMICPSQ